MKKFTKIFVLAIASMVALASCAKNELNENPAPAGTVIKAYFDEGLTKTALNSDYQVVWSLDDAISAFDIEGTQYTSSSTTVSTDGLVAEFKFNIEEEFYYAIFPADSKATMSNEGVITTTLPLVQNAVAGGFDPKANLAISQAVDNTAKFLNGGALIGFEIKNDDIKKIEFESNLNLAGPCYISIDNNNEPLLQSTYAEEINKVTLQGNFEKGKTYYAVVFPTNYSGLKMTFTREDGKTAVYNNSASLELDGLRNAAMTVFSKEIPDSKWQGGESSVHDIFTSSDFPAESSTYVDFTGVKKNTAVYAGNSSLNNGISLRSKNSNSGIVTTTSGGSIKSVTVKWNSACVTGRTLDVYGSNSAYTSASDLYNSATQGDKLGSIVMGTSTSVTISDVYAYVAVRSKEGALNLDEIDFEWGAGSAPVTKYDVICSTVTGGTISATPTKAAAGTTVTLTAEPTTGYEFESWNVTGATVVDATSATTTFTMPAANVNVSATFKEITSIPDKTIAEFIAAKGGNCYLTGVVSNIVNTTYGNFDLADNSGKIYIYGCLTSEGVARQFSTLGVDEGDEIKVLASEYEYFQSTTHEAKNVVFVEIVKKAQKYNVSVASGIANGTVTVNPAQAAEGQTVTITATPATGYKLKSVSAKKTASGTALTVTDNKFTMPAEAVTVSAEFEVSAGGDPVTVTWVAKDAEGNPGNGNDWLSGNIDGNISWSATKGGTNNPKYYDAGTGLRVYNGGTFTVSAANGKKITKIVLTFSGASYTFSTSNTTTPQTYTLDSVESYSWDVSRTCRLQKVEVTYK